MAQVAVQRVGAPPLVIGDMVIAGVAGGEEGARGASPSKKSVSRLRQKVGDLLVRQNVAPWPELRDQLNRILRGWSNYFGYGTRLMAYRAVDHYVYDRMRYFLRHRHKVSSRGLTIFSDVHN